MSGVPLAATAERMFHKDATIPAAGWVFVFGSNLKGRHGKGAAKVAHQEFGAVYGQGSGRTGRAYAIPTKVAPTMEAADVLSLDTIGRGVASFLEHARAHPSERFFVTRVGCGLSGYRDEQIAPMFRDAPSNCSLPEPWRRYVGT